MVGHVGVRTWAVGAAVALVAIAVAVYGVAHRTSSGSHDRETARGSSSSAPSRVATPPRTNDLAAVLSDWTDEHPAARAVVGVQAGTHTTVWSASAALSERTRFRVMLHGVDGSLTTPAALMRYANDELRAHARGARDLGTSYFRIGRDGHGRGVDGFTSDGFCAYTARGCAPGTPFFAVGAAGSGPGGSAAVVYDPAVDLGIVAMSRARNADLTDLVQRALLLTTLGRSGYEHAVDNTAHRAPSATHG